MAKTLMRETMREGILDWMKAEYDAKHAGDMEKPLAKALVVINKAIRIKYPEADMVVLRKYNLTRHDGCIKIMNADTQQVSGVEFFSRRDRYDAEKTKIIADVPNDGGCHSGDVFPLPSNAFSAVENFTKTKEELSDARESKFQQYKSFLAACKTVDEFNETVPLPDDLKKRYMVGGALIAISPETIADIRKDFKKKAA